MIDSGLYKPDDIFVLGASSTAKSGTVEKKNKGQSIITKKEASPFVRLANALSKKEHLVHVKNDHNDAASIECTKNKIVFSSFHQAKGRERKVVFLCGFDDSYFEYYANNMWQDNCPNTMYVGLTRAKERLYIVQDASKQMCNFMNLKNIKKYAKIKGTHSLDPCQSSPEPYSTVRKTKSVTEFLRNLSSSRQRFIVGKSGFLKITQIKGESTKLNLTNECHQKIRGTKIKEHVSDVNGVATVSFFEYIVEGRMTIVTEGSKESTDPIFRKKCQWMISQHKDTIKDIVHTDIFAQELLKTALMDRVISASANFRLNQITDFSWVDNISLMEAYARLRSNVIVSKYEVSSKVYLLSNSIDSGLCGRYDMVAGYRMYEIKSVASISDEHIIQTAIYALMRQQEHDDNKDSKNIQDKCLHCQTNEAIHHIKNKLNDLMQKETFDIGDPVVSKKYTGYIYRVLDDKYEIIDVKNIAGKTIRLPKKNVRPNIEFYETQLRTLEQDLIDAIPKNYLYNVRTDELHMVEVIDPIGLREFLSGMASENLTDEEFIDRMCAM